MSDLTAEAEKSRANKIALRDRMLTARRKMTDNAQRLAAQDLQDQTLAWVRREAPSVVAAYVPVGPEPGSRALLDALASLVSRVLLPVLLPDNDLDWAAYSVAPPPERDAVSADLLPERDAASASLLSERDAASADLLPERDAVAADLLSERDAASASLLSGPGPGPGGAAASQNGLSVGRFGLLEPVGDRLGPSALASADLILVPALAVDRAGRRMGRGGGSYDRALSRLGQPSPLILALLHDGELVDAVPAEPHDVPVHGVITPREGVILL